jgi:predicted unusual protein kinase regulating ubiquinone biosynthesis (AarF/ABC1/UbiB family)
MIRLLLIAFITLPLSSLQSQSVLDRYVEEAINNNLSVKEKELLEQKELYSLERAGKEAGPEVRLLTSYTLAAGGRTIELPIGDLLNDVYSSLENLTGQPFPPG